jgi:hypothetical protein
VLGFIGRRDFITLLGDAATRGRSRQGRTWYLPLYRQVQILAGQSVHLDRATLRAG